MTFIQTDNLNRSGLFFQIIYIFMLLYVPNLLLKSWLMSLDEGASKFILYLIIAVAYVLYGLWLLLMTLALGRRFRDFNLSHGFAFLFPIVHIFFGFFAWIIVLLALIIPGKQYNNY